MGRAGAGILPPVRFAKWQALGNDYVVLEARDLPFELTAARIRAICAPHLGVGSDGILLLSGPADPAHVADLRIFNPDGSEAMTRTTTLWDRAADAPLLDARGRDTVLRCIANQLQYSGKGE